MIMRAIMAVTAALTSMTFAHAGTLTCTDWQAFARAKTVMAT